MERKNLALSIGIAVILSLVFTGCKISKKQTDGKKENPFKVAVGGQKADRHNGVFAKIAKPVAGDAEVVVDLRPESDVIINIFECDAQGDNRGKPEVIIIPKKGNKTKISDKISGKKPLPSGSYIMDIVCNSQIAKVFFIVK